MLPRPVVPQSSGGCPIRRSRSFTAAVLGDVVLVRGPRQFQPRLSPILFTTEQSVVRAR
jgi:hypothetical protein